jgi:hypothetical protein
LIADLILSTAAFAPAFQFQQVAQLNVRMFT